MVGLRANRIRIEVRVRKTGVRNPRWKSIRGISSMLPPGEVLGEVLAWSDDRKEEKAGAFLTGQNNTMEDIASGSVVAVFRCNSGNNANVGIR